MAPANFLNFVAESSLLEKISTDVFMVLGSAAGHILNDPDAFFFVMDGYDVPNIVEERA